VNRTEGEPFPLQGEPDEETVRLLRRALAREAEAVEPGDGLGRIQQRIGGDGGRRWVPWAAAAAAAAVVGLVVGAFLGFGARDQAQVAGPSPSATDSSAVPSEPAPSSPSSPSTGAPVETGNALPVYWLGEQGSRLALFREFVGAGPSDPAARVQEAVTRALSGSPADPDYRTAWPRGSAATTSVAGGQIRIDLNAAATSGTAMGSEVAQRSVEQLVWTATAAAGENLPVRVTVEGATPDLFGTVALAQPFLRAGGEGDPRALVWITSLSDGEMVKPGALRVTGEGVNAFENTLTWRLERDGATADQGFFGVEGARGAAVDLGQRGTWSLGLDLDPGSYTLTVEVPDESGGESTIRWFDSKRFTVT
jgi:hypothetical protein